MPNIKCYLDDLGGAGGIDDMADLFPELTKTWLRDWAADNDVPRVGNAYVFTLKQAQALADDLAADEDEEEDLDGDSDGEDEDDFDGDPDDSDDDGCDTDDD